MFFHVIACTAICLVAGSENLLRNPGFDEVDAQGLPLRWDLFVMPMEGAEGRVESDASGSSVVLLHNPQTYVEEPANNWSQVIIDDFEGKTLVLSAEVKTEEVGEAAVWLQCFRKNPARVLAAWTTNATTPLSGTQDWTHVELDAEVPAGTDFIVVRCVLKGSGTAWFDAISVIEAPGPDSKAEPSGADVADVDVGRMDERNLEDLVALRESMWGAIEALRQTNSTLIQQIGTLEEQLDAVRQTLLAVDTLPLEAAPIEPLFGPHPLIPRGHNEEADPK
ncbi:MAG: hypothetical protein IID08_06455 [Candidatus Hydrogenedentes bacterium]|nr:hypothetical protein [Candidatus Hydrogenedentota bacterium]